MIDGREKYLREHFTTACILKGKVSYLEEIKKYIVDMYVRKGFLKMVKPTYSRKISITDEFQCIQKSFSQSDGLYLAFILRGEVLYCEQVYGFIHSFVEQGLVTMETTPYSKGKQFIRE